MKNGSKIPTLTRKVFKKEQECYASPFENVSLLSMLLNSEPVQRNEFIFLKVIDIEAYTGFDEVCAFDSFTIYDGT